MALNIKDDRADRLARELAATTGETITQAVTVAVAERLERLRGIAGADGRRAEILRIGRMAAALPVLDDRDPDEILGYDEHGFPG
jgi:antitoxin VapB